MTKKIKENLSNQKNDHLEVILFLPKLVKKRKKMEDIHQILDELIHEKHLTESVVFLQLEKALQYSRFMQNNHLLVRAFLPHHAIEGHTHGLTIKKGILTKKHIHGFYPGKNSSYIENPAFAKNT